MKTSRTDDDVMILSVTIDYLRNGNEEGRGLDSIVQEVVS